MHGPRGDRRLFRADEGFPLFRGIIGQHQEVVPVPCKHAVQARRDHRAHGASAAHHAGPLCAAPAAAPCNPAAVARLGAEADEGEDRPLFQQVEAVQDEREKPARDFHIRETGVSYIHCRDSPWLNSCCGRTAGCAVRPGPAARLESGGDIRRTVCSTRQDMGASCPRCNKTGKGAARPHIGRPPPV